MGTWGNIWAIHGNTGEYRRIQGNTEDYTGEYRGINENTGE